MTTDEHLVRQQGAVVPQRPGGHNPLAVVQVEMRVVAIRFTANNLGRVYIMCSFSRRQGQSQLREVLLFHVVEKILVPALTVSCVQDIAVDRLSQFLRIDGFEQVIKSGKADRLNGVLIKRSSKDHLKRPRGQRHQPFKPTYARHLDIQKDQIRLKPGQL